VSHFTLRPAPDAVLRRARLSTEVEQAGSFASPPAGAHELWRAAEFEGSFERARDGLFRWDVQRGAGLKVLADGPVQVGGTVVVGLHLGPVWALAPSRVIALVDDDEAAGFTYATLPGHPELGVEEFMLTRVGDRVRFELHAVSTQATLPGRLAPPVARWVQSVVTDRYLRAAADIAAGR